MRGTRAWLAGGLAAGLGLIAGAAPARAQEDAFGGLPDGPGQEATFYACNACHSVRLVTQQRLSRQRWDALLDWMVAKQGMAPLPPEERAVVLDYLAAQLNPDTPR
ncbi:MAG: aldehyde dehydrogenase [Geminicoccales bacterium]